MRMMLTKRQIQGCLSVASERHGRYLTNRRPWSKDKEVIVMPWIGWSTLVERLAQRAFSQIGFRSSQAPSGVSSALTAVARGVADWESHPALRCEALPGRHTEIIPVFGGNGVWSLVPNSGAFMVLLPEHERIRAADGMLDITRWNPVRSESCPRIDGVVLSRPEHEHWDQVGA